MPPIGKFLYDRVPRVRYRDVIIAFIRQKYHQKLGSTLFYAGRFDLWQLVNTLKVLTKERVELLPEKTDQNWVKLFYLPLCLNAGLFPAYYDANGFYFLTEHNQNQSKSQNFSITNAAIELIRKMYRYQKYNPETPKLNYNNIQPSQIKITLCPQQVIFASLVYFLLAFSKALRY